ncbi:MAG: hypothetical protein IGS48_12680 [Oscillatoriales cyanobacterium C42_A2020_001]|nr:hypothetical protein [Leptolyngbyaceae cyanobacterium C42_A2020_001]
MASATGFRESQFGDRLSFWDFGGDLAGRCNETSPLAPTGVTKKAVKLHRALLRHPQRVTENQDFT